MNIEDSTFKKWLPTYQIIIYLVIVMHSCLLAAFDREPGHFGWGGLLPYVFFSLLAPLMLFYTLIFLIITIVKLFIYKADPNWVKVMALLLTIATIPFSYYAFYIVCLKKTD